MSITRQDFDHYMVPVFAPAEFIPVRGQGSRLWAQDGREYIDFVAGIAVNGLGYSHPVAVQALKNQADKIWHVSNLFTNEPALTLAKKLVEHTFADKVFFCNSGAEANEAALKLARKVGKLSATEHKNQIIAFDNSFHGRTLFTVSTAGQPKYSKEFAPLPQGIQHVPFNDLDAVKAIINQQTCAVIVEPIQGEGGVIPAEREFLQGLRQLCDEYQAVLIFDEVQTGMGRTGQLFSYMETGVTPDILTSAKALGNGFPIGAMLTTDKFAQQFAVGDHGTTYGGNPLATAVASAVFDVINSAEVLTGVQERFVYFQHALEKINAKYSIFKQIRGRGLLIGCVMQDQYAGKAKDLSQLAMEEGVLTLLAGADVIRLVPSLIIPYQDIDEGLQRFEQAVAKFITTL